MGEPVTALSHWVLSVNYQGTGNPASGYLKELKQNPAMLDSVDQIARKYNMALGYSQSGDYDLAILQLKNSISINPHFVQGYLLLALLYIRINNYEKARTTLRRILKIDKANAQAIHYLHEMGDSDENIIHLQMESIENDGLLEDEYLDEASAADEGSGTGKQLMNMISSRYKQQTAGTDKYSETRFARFSGLYVLVGLVLGILILFFVVVPAQKKSLKTENEELIKAYSEELANKNASITALNNEIDSLNGQIAQMEADAKAAENQLPDYSGLDSGMSDEDIKNIIDNE
jgi:tetratricopeptide (TPR) repeat protein